MFVPKITDEMIVQWIEDGTLYIADLDTDPELWFRGRRIKAELARPGRYSSAHPGAGMERYAWGLRFNGRRRKIVRGKLVWMFSHRRTVPSGCVIHHVDGNRLNDAIGNLELLTEENHFSLHHPDLPEY